MSITTIIALGQSATDSDDILIADGASLSVGMFATSGVTLHGKSHCYIMQRAPQGGQPLALAKLTSGAPGAVANLPILRVYGPCTIFGRRPAQTDAALDVGMFLDDGLGSPA